MQGTVVWAPFGATCWPAKLVRLATSCEASSGHLRGQSQADCPDTSQKALVELFGTGLRIDVSVAGLTAWATECTHKCTLLQSDMGKQVLLPC